MTPEEFQQEFSDNVAKDMAEVELETIEQEIIEEMLGAIEAMNATRCTLADVQPPTSVMLHAAEAAASVIMAFERGYRMSGDRMETDDTAESPSMEVPA